MENAEQRVVGDNEGTSNDDDVPVITPMNIAMDDIPAEWHEEASGNEGGDNSGSSVAEVCKLFGETPVHGHEVRGWLFMQLIP